MKLKLMTYNVASGRYYGDIDCLSDGGSAYEDPAKCAKVILGEAPDVCGINEVNVLRATAESANQAEYFAKKGGLENVFFGKAISFDLPKEEVESVFIVSSKGYYPAESDTIYRDYGNAVATKHKIISAEVIPIPNPEIFDEHTYYEQRSISKVKIDVNGTQITVLQLHVGLAVSEAQNAIDTLCKAIDEIEGPIVLMGDFNMRPNNYLLRPIRERLFDTADIKDEYIATFPSYPLIDYPPCKIDYIFVSKEFKVLDVIAPKVQVSDHLPLICEVEI